VTKMVCRMSLSGHARCIDTLNEFAACPLYLRSLPELVHCGQMTLSTKRGLMQCSRYCRFIRAMRRREARMFLGL
jgi:hypothetical protein